jgi:quercetin dioxygenase-like cupin family protein
MVIADTTTASAVALQPGVLLREIAAGYGLVTAAVATEPTGPLRRELVLSTPTYDVWVMSWPAGEAADLHTHEQHVAFHVVSGSLVEERIGNGATTSRTHLAGDTVVVPPATPHRLISLDASTTVHVHAKELA